MKETNGLGRHGDLIFTNSSKRPKGKMLSKGAHVLAEGEFTGHKHIITAVETGQMVNVWREIDTITIEVPEGGAKVSHEEHKPFILVKGIYDMRIKREYDPFIQRIKQVQD